MLPDPGFTQSIITKVVGDVVVSVVKKAGSALGALYKSDEIKDQIADATDQYGRMLAEQLAQVRILEMAESKYVATFFVKPTLTSTITMRSSLSGLDLPKYVADNALAGNELDGLTQITPGVRLVLLGKPGAGKSTFLQFAALKSLQEVHGSQLPVFLMLREVVAAGQTLHEAMVAQFERCGMPAAEQFVRNSLEEGRLALFVDGLDEVPGELVKSFTSEIRTLSRTGVGNTWVVTCRDGVYDYWFSEFKELELLPFTEEQIGEFIRGWFSTRPVTAARCQEQLDAAPHIKELVSVPLLLALFCISFEANREVAPGRSEFFSDAVDVLLRRWDATREIDRDDSPISGCGASADAYRRLSRARKEELLASIAGHSLESGVLLWTETALAGVIDTFFAQHPASTNTSPPSTSPRIRAGWHRSGKTRSWRNAGAT